jgi:hypothetical protein
MSGTVSALGLQIADCVCGGLPAIGNRAAAKATLTTAPPAYDALTAPRAGSRQRYRRQGTPGRWHLGANRRQTGSQPCLLMRLAVPQ